MQRDTLKTTTDKQKQISKNVQKAYRNTHTHTKTKYKIQKSVRLKPKYINASVKRQLLVEWVKKYDPTPCYLQKSYFKYSDIDRLKIKEWKSYIITTTI